MSTIHEKMNKTISDFNSKLASLRTNRANPEMIQNIQVSYYGSSTPLQQLASISVPESTQFLLHVFDQSAVKDIESAIMQSSLQLTPQTDGTSIRIALPELTEQRRNDLVKVLKQMGEDAKIAIRNIRRDFMDNTKSDEKNKSITEDDSKRIQSNIQDETNTFISKIEQSLKDKETEILTI